MSFFQSANPRPATKRPLPSVLLRLKNARVQAALLSTIMNSPKEPLLPLSYASKSYRPIANPSPLGLFGFAIAITLVSIPKLAARPPADPLFFAVALFLGGFAQILAAIYHFLLNNLHAANTFGLYGFHWCSQAVLEMVHAFPSIAAVPKADRIDMLVYNCLLAISTTVLWIPSFRIDRFVCTTLFLLIMVFTFDAVAVFDHRWAAIVSAISGILAALVSFYMALAIFVTDAWNKSSELALQAPSSDT
ncbi:hypothetical protein BWQ96_05712 [Gracilariopsis chorda]|uniref:Uncharacterized protein n=1 Tax=Gracilariopsis chorda TaxID=448386 RepID=A0A2V3IR13_9FLOR|nr:hypothetical protein BWQ96_05712 [Gracilariopsis chorda]|eukprot:PXF44534.1 hypothetical protein BWQ96_05712 [Gracilariopsis chorda]